MIRDQFHNIFVRSSGWMLLLTVLIYAAPASATLFSQITKLTGTGSAAGDWAGYSVAVSADNKTLIFGAPQASVNGQVTGEVFVFVNDNGTWTQQATLNVPALVTSSFGSSVALSANGNTAVIGAPYATVGGTSSGMVYVFTRNGSTWTEQTSFSNPTPASGGSFGTYVALSGNANTLLIGAPAMSVGSLSSAGAVFSYSQANGKWSGPATITASDASASAQFGNVALSSDGTMALVGAPGAEKAYFFSQSGGNWTQTQTVSDPVTGNGQFGSAVALSGDGHTALVGAKNTTVAGGIYGTNAGQAYAYTFDNGAWGAPQTIANPDNSDTGSGSTQGFDEYFGTAVALSADGNTAMVTAIRGVTGDSKGKAFMFARSGTSWTETKEVDDPPSAQNDHFGISATLSTDGSTAFVGSYWGSISHYVYVIASTADLALTLKADHASAAPGQSITYMLTATNNDTEVTATNVTVSDTLPSGTTATNSTTGCSGTTGTVTCVQASLAPGATYQPSITISAPANVTGTPFNITNSATLSADQPDPNTGNNSASVPVIVLAGSGGNAPVASNATVSTPEGQAVNGTLSATGSGTLTFAIATPPSHGTATLGNAETGAFTYTPASGFSGTDSFTFTASNTNGVSNTGTETVTVTASSSGGGSSNGGSSGGGASSSGSGGSGGGGAFGLLGLGLLTATWKLKIKRRPPRGR